MKEWLINIFIVLGIFFIIGFILTLPARFEANSYNKLTGGQASTWDAIWVQLRVDCPTVKETKESK